MKKSILCLVILITSLLGYSQNTDHMSEIIKNMGRFSQGETKETLPILEKCLSEKNLPDYLYALVVVGLNQYYITNEIDKFDIQSVNKFVDQFANNQLLLEGKEMFDINLAIYSIASELNREVNNYPKQVDYLLILKQVYENFMKDSALTDYGYITAIENLSQAYYYMNMPDMGIENGEKALELSEKYLSKTNEYRIIPYFLARNYILKENYQKAYEIYDQAIRIAKEIYGDKTANYSSLIDIIANDYSSLGDYQKSIELNEQVLKTTNERVGEWHPDYFLCANNLALNYFYSNNYQKSIELYESFIPKAKAVLGEHATNYLTFLENLETAYSNINEYTKTLELNQRLSDLKKEVLGERHTDYLSSLNNLAYNYSKLGDFSKAQEIDQKVVVLRKEILGERHPNYLTSLSNLAHDYSNLGDYNKALEINQKVVVLRKEILGERHPDYLTSLSNLAHDYSNLGDYNKALEINQKVVDIRKEILGERHSDYLTSLSNLANTYSLLGNYKKSLEIGLGVVNVKKEVLGEYHPDYLTSLGNLASTYSALGNYPKALEINQTVVKSRKEICGESHPLYLLSLDNLACIYSYLGDYNNALETELKVVNLRKDVLGEHHPDYLLSLIHLASFHKDRGELAIALDINKRVVNITKDILGIHHPQYLLSLNNLSSCYSLLGDFDSSLKILQNLIESIKENLGDRHPDYFTSLSNLAFCYSGLGDYGKAIEINQKLVDEKREVLGNHHPDYLTSLSNLAQSYYEQGDYSKAIEIDLAVSEIRKEVLGDRHPDYLISLNNLAHDYLTLGNDAKAFIITINVVNLQKEILGELHTDYLSSLSNLALLHSNLINNDESIEINQKVVDLRKKVLGDRHPDYLLSLENLAQAYSNLGDNVKALEIEQDLMDVKKEVLGARHPNYILSLNNLAQIYFHLENHNQAIEIGQKVVKLSKIVFGKYHPTYLVSLSNLAGMEFFLSQNDSSLIHYQEFLKAKKDRVVEYFSSMTENERGLFWTQNTFYFELFPFFLENTHTTYPDAVGDGYDAALFSKCLLLNTTLDFDKLIAEKGTPETIAKFEELKLLKLQIQRLLEKPVAERLLNVDSLENIAQQKETELVRLSKEYGDYTRNMKISWKDVQARLGEKDVAVEFVEYPTLTDTVRYAALVLRKGWQYPKMIPLFRKDQVEEFLGQDKDQLYSNGYVGKQVKKLIWSPLEQVISEGDNVYFSASGIIHQLAIENLAATDTQTLGDLYHLYRLSSTKEMALKKEQQNNQSAVLYGGLVYDLPEEKMVLQSRRYDRKENLYAMRGYQNDTTLRKGWDYLEGTLGEVEQINRMMKDKKYRISLYTGESGNEESFKSLSGKSKGIIHIATHGFFLPVEDTKKNLFIQQRMGDESPGRPAADPMLRSGLMFSGGNRAWQGETVPEDIEDGVLTAKEISHLDLRGTGMVVLSACETGLGDVSSEGVFGLQRSFKQAGVQTLVMSLWEVSDKATNYMMGEFYSNMLKGTDKREAFARAKKSCKQMFPEPRYWAAFIMLD